MAVLLAAPQASAQSLFPGADEWAEAIVASEQHRTWEGPRTPWPEEHARPTGTPSVLRSSLRPVAVHAAAGQEELAERALGALEAAHDLLRAAHWPEPYPDGGLGETATFDLYLVSSEHPADAFSDGPLPWTLLDGVSSFGVVDPAVDAERLSACVTSAYVQAALLGQDPAEAAAWRRATGTFAAYLVTGILGCDDAVSAQQQEPWRSWISGAAGDGAGGALFLALVSHRFDSGTGVFVRELWQLTRQHTRETDEGDLRASPDLWAALARAIEIYQSDLGDVIEEQAVSRYFTGEQERRAASPIPSLTALPSDGSVPIFWSTSYGDLPRHSPPHEPELWPFGSAYAMVDVSSAAPDSRLRVWLRGEFGVKWGLTAVRLDAAGRELARVSAPPTRRPNGYVPVELGTGTDRVLIVATNMSSRLPDADVPDENVRTFKLVVDRDDE